jgi:hypothetical protein
VLIAVGRSEGLSSQDLTGLDSEGKK